MRERGQLNGRAGSRARSRDGTAHFHWRGALAACATDAHRERLDRVARNRNRRDFRLVVRAVLSAVAGLGLGKVLARYFEALLYQVKATELSMLAFPSATLLLVALVAALPPVIRAIQIDPAATLRAE